MDTLDHQLIGLLRDNARTTVLDMARALGVSRATVQNRMRRLEQEGVILGYTVRLQAPGAQAPIRALMLIQVDGDGDALTPLIQAEPSVRMLHTTNGRWDLRRWPTLIGCCAVFGRYPAWPTAKRVCCCRVAPSDHDAEL